MDDDAEGGVGRLPRQAAPDAPPPASGEELRVSPNKNRLLQVQRAGARKLFDEARKEVFLEWLAATCNVALSAQMAGICDKTVYKHLLKDEAFVEAYVHALRIGYLRLEAREMQEAHGFGRSGTSAEADPSTASGGPPPHSAKPNGEDYKIGILDDDLAEEHFDPALAMQLLREHRRHLPGSSEKRPAQRTTAESATSKEVAEALAKRLKGFAIRMGSSPVIASGAKQSSGADDWIAAAPSEPRNDEE